MGEKVLDAAQSGNPVVLFILGGIVAVLFIERMFKIFKGLYDRGMENRKPQVEELPKETSKTVEVGKEVTEKIYDKAIRDTLEKISEAIESLSPNEKLIEQLAKLTTTVEQLNLNVSANTQQIKLQGGMLNEVSKSFHEMAARWDKSMLYAEARKERNVRNGT